MSLFDLGMKLKGLKSKRRKFTSSILPNWAYGEELHTDSDFNTLVNAYRGWVYIATSRNATSVAKADLRLYATKEKKSDKIKSFSNKEVDPRVKDYVYKSPVATQKSCVRQSEDIVEITDHPFLDLMNNVNNFTNQFTLFEQTESFLSLVGNAFWYIVDDRMGIPRELWVLPPQNVRIIPDKTTFIKGYEYFKNGCFFGKNEGVFYPEKNIVHFKVPSPTNYYYGCGSLRPVLDEVIMGENMNQFEAGLFKHSQNISGTWTTDAELSDNEFERIKSEITSAYSGNSNAGKNPLLDNGLRFTPFSYSKKDLSFQEGRQYIMEVVLAAFGQSKSMISHESTRSNAESGIRLYQETTVKPKLHRIEQKLTEKLLPRYSDRLFCCFSDPVDSDKEMDLKELRTWIDLGMTSVDEQRGMRGMSKFNSETSDLPFKAVNMMPADLLGKTFENMGADDKVESIKLLNEIANRFDERMDKEN